MIPPILALPPIECEIEEKGVEINIPWGWGE